MKNIFITANDYTILSNILKTLPYDVIVFGSRIKGTQQKLSDLDLCLKTTNIALVDMAQLKEALSNSELPFIVDVVDYNDVSQGFKKIIDEQGANFFDTRPALS